MIRIGRQMALLYMILNCIGFAPNVARAITAGEWADDVFIAGGKVLPLRPNQSEPAPAGQPGRGEQVDERGEDGVHNRTIANVNEPTLTVYLPDKPDANRPAIVICPGGGYRILAIDKEGYAIARRLNDAGIAAVVLKYRLPADKPPPAEGVVPAPIQDVQQAIRLTRAKAKEWNIDPARIGVMGFSAGGHVASTAAVRFDAGDPSADDPAAQQSSRPDFAVLLYPVVSMKDAPAHKGSRHNLLGKKPSPAQIERYSGELNVSKQTPPLFIVHAKDDKGVVVENSTKLADAAKAAGVPHELVLFETGGHGFGLGAPDSESAAWFDKLLTWMRDQKFLK